MARARPGRPTLNPCKGGLTRRGFAQGEVELVGHDCARNARGAHAARSPGPLVRLERREGRRLLPIVMVVKLALHHRQRACATRRAISGREGQCMGRHGPLRALEQGFSTGGQRGLPGRSKRGAVALRGAKGLSSPLCGEGASLRFCPGLFYIVLSALSACGGGLEGPRAIASFDAHALPLDQAG
jgi:hypothetical protein